MDKQIKTYLPRWLPRYSNCDDDIWVIWQCSHCGYVRKKGWIHTDAGREPKALFCEMCGRHMNKD